MTKTNITTPIKHNETRPLNFFYSIRRALLSGWSVPLSSDGYSHYGASNVLKNDHSGPHGFGNTNAWCVLSKTINNQLYQFCIQNDGYMGLRIKYSKLGFGNNMDNLGRSPLASDQEILIGGGTDLAPIYQQIVKGIISFHMNEVLIMLTDAAGGVIKFSLKPPLPIRTPNAPTRFIKNKILT